MFFFSGKKLPSFARISLAKAASIWPGATVLLTDVKCTFRSAVSVDFFPSWFNQDDFGSFQSRSSLDKSFRDGFWLKAAQRFFVLDQWSRKNSVERFVHCELDVAILRPNDVADLVQNVDRGIFIPRVSENLAIASTVIVAGEDSMVPLIDFMVRKAYLGHEMRILGEFLRLVPELGQALPTTSDLAGRISPLSFPQTSPAVAFGNILFDAAQVGHWILGTDARNIRGKAVRNHFEWDYGSDSVSLHRTLFRHLRWRSGNIEFATRLGTFHLLTLHCHSKSMRLAYSRLSRGLLTRIAMKANSTILPIPFVLTPFRMSKAKGGLDLLLVRWRRFLFD